MDREIPQHEIRQARRRRIFIGAGICVASVLGVFALGTLTIVGVKRDSITIGEVTIGTIETSVNRLGYGRTGF